MKLVVATRNEGKLKEIRRLLEGSPLEVVSVAQWGELPEVEEDGDTFEENAIKKAQTIAFLTGCWTLADDSGLCVDSLGGDPGVRSARYAGEGSSDEANNLRLLQALSGVPAAERKAQFRCAMALCSPEGECRTFEGAVAGIILDAPRGDGGFGYDPLFLVKEYGKTMAELPLEIKNRISHRGQALGRAMGALRSLA